MKNVQVFDETNSIVIDDDYMRSKFSFFPEKKKFTVSNNSKDNTFYASSTIEYKISINPVEIQMRTVESSDEPPLEYSIKDGVVLEAELRNNRVKLFGKLDEVTESLLEERINELKKLVEWKKISISNNYEVNLFILSKHPELVSKEEYEKLLEKR